MTTGTETVLERIKRITATQLSVDESKVVLEANFKEDLGADSLDLVELIMAIEEEFGKDGKKVEIPDDDAGKILTVQNAVDYLKNLGITD